MREADSLPDSSPPGPAGEAERRRRILSALADGDADAGEQDLAFRAWRDDEGDARATWHAYQLIGDVLRRDDLATPVGHDTALLRAVRARLAQEPVVLAPQNLPAPPAVARPAVARRLGGWARAHWQAPAAMAAGFVLVAGGLSMRPGDPARPAAVAQAVMSPPAVAGGGAGGASIAPMEPTPAAMDVTPYLVAHRQSIMQAAVFRMPDARLSAVSWKQPAP